jgi:hypothetical protein
MIINAWNNGIRYRQRSQKKSLFVGNKTGIVKTAHEMHAMPSRWRRMAMHFTA